MRNYAETCKGICGFNLVYNFFIELLPIKSYVFVAEIFKGIYHAFIMKTRHSYIWHIATIVVWMFRKSCTIYYENILNFHQSHNHVMSLLCHSSSIRWYISFLHFKTFKIQFCGVPFLHYVLVFKIHIYMQKMTFSSLLT